MPVMAQNKPLLVLFDGNALIHRAFHALPPLAVTRTGEPTGAVSGFATMVLKVLSELKPTHCAVAFDHPSPTFRHKEFAAYKAQRKEAPEDLKRQFKRVHQLVDAFNIASFEAEGYEADDILGTLARQASEEGIDTIIVTGDMDTLQLVEPRVKVMTPKPGKPFSDTVLYDEGKVQERYGLTPKQIADLKGLQGDASDNIPGVPGVGEKTAVKLLQQFQTIDGIYQHIDEVQPAKAHSALAQNEEAARQSKRLATIVTDIPIDLDLPHCAVGGFDRNRVVDLFRELEFNRLMGRLDELGSAGCDTAVKVEKVETDYRTVDTEQALGEMVDALRAAESFAFDTETTSLNPMYARLVGLSFCHAAGKSFYVPVGHRLGEQLPLNEVLDKVRPLFTDPKYKKSAHHGKYDMSVLANSGVDVQGLEFDTMIAAHLIGEKSIGLKALAFNRLGVEMTPIASLIGSGAKQVTMDYVPVAEVSPYACADADMTFRLACLLEDEVKGQNLWDLFHDVEMPLMPVLLQMERNGVALDTEALWAMSEGMGRRAAELEADIYNSVGHQFNINSSQQLSAVLFEELRLPGGRKTKSGYSTDAAVLEGLRGLHPIIAPLLEYRQITKLKSTYVDSLPALVNPGTGRIHTSFNQTGTATGRLSSSDPNLQNIPVRGEMGRQVRRAFVAGDGCVLLSGDYSQIDLRVMAHLSQDEKLLAAFRRDDDIHRATAADYFGVPPSEVTPDMRRLAKVVNFGVLYGMSGYGLEQATELSREEASRFIKTYFEKYSGVRDYLEATRQQAREKGYVETLLGRRRYIPDINASNGQARAAAERMAINMPVQGTSADIIKLAMIRIPGELAKRGLKSRMTLQVHDELVFEVPREERDAMTQLVLDVMPNALELSVPLTVEVKSGDNWGEMG